MALTSSRNCGLFPPGGPSSCGAVTSDMYNGARRARRIAVRSSKLLMASPIIACRMKTEVVTRWLSSEVVEGSMTTSISESSACARRPGAVNKNISLQSSKLISRA